MCESKFQECIALIYPDMYKLVRYKLLMAALFVIQKQKIRKLPKYPSIGDRLSKLWLSSHNGIFAAIKKRRSGLGLVKSTNKVPVSLTAYISTSVFISGIPLLHGSLWIVSSPDALSVKISFLHPHS